MIEQREKLYDDIRDNCDVVVDNGVQLEINLNQSQIITLKLAIENYVLTTLESYYGKKFERKNFLVKNRDDILNLPNRTPNGAFYPKVENIEEYNIIQSIVNDILNENDLINQLSSYDVCTVRVVDGEITDLDERSAATTKLHSDAWSGHKGDAILTIALLGDETTSLEFHKVVGGVSPSFFETQPNYEEGLHLFDDCELLGKLKFNNITIFDHACLHRTSKENGGLRVSIDFGITLSTSKGVDKKNKFGRDVEHRSIDEMLKIGKETFVEATETLEECYNRFKDDKYDKVAVSHINDIIR
jgi:hypothetical protein|tara:strand:+ start:197 stop:1099 length:903 start_codon:yes stop_codon:yes gene_type:complete